MLSSHLYKFVALFCVVAAFGAASCSSNDSGATSAGCLTPEEVERQVSEVAAGIETTQEEVDAKQAEIQEIRDQECE